jgi:hypothetical protein
MTRGYSQKELLAIFNKYDRFILESSTLTRTYNSLCKLLNKGIIKHSYYVPYGEVFELEDS